MQYIASNIKFDTDGEDVLFPDNIIVEVPDHITDKDEIEEVISEFLTDSTGFCHDGFTYTKK
jgi:hypothetical protein